MHEEERFLRQLIASVAYDPDLFKIYIGNDKYIFGYVSTNGDDDGYFAYQTLYDTIVDLDRKIKKSFDLALHWEYRCDINKFNMISPPSVEEEEAIYYTENAVFRTSVLWDLLAQLYNVRYNNNKNPEKVFYSTLFHNATQGKNPNLFAQSVYTYLSEIEPEDHIYQKHESWIGNHKYVVDYRNKMTHRNSPNIASMSSYDIELRMPMRYVLKRVVEDYVKASEFIQLMLKDIQNHLTVGMD